MHILTYLPNSVITLASLGWFEKNPPIINIDAMNSNVKNNAIMSGNTSKVTTMVIISNKTIMDNHIMRFLARRFCSQILSFLSLY